MCGPGGNASAPTLTRTETMTTGTIITVDGIDYHVTNMGENIHGHGTVLALNKMGRRGKPTKAERPGFVRKDGAISLGPWL